MAASPDVTLQAEYGRSFKIGAQPIVKALRGRVSLPDELTYAEDVFSAEVSLADPDKNIVYIVLSTDYATIDTDPQATNSQALLPLGDVATIVRNRNDRQHMVAEIEELPLSLSIASSIADTGVIVEFPNNAKIDGQMDRGKYVDLNTDPNDPNVLQESDTVYIPLSRAYQLGDAKITIRRGI